MGKNALWKEIENAKWSARIEILCSRLNIPLLTSRGDLRKVHRNFPEIQQKLKNCYNDNMTRVLVQGTVVAIYARMCIDSSLRNKLASEKSFYTRILRLLDSSVCRTVALQCLVTLTFYGDREFCYRIAGYIPEVLKLAQGNMDDPSVINACATIICRPVSMALCPGKDSDQVPHQQALESVGPLLPIFTFFIALLRNSNTTYDTYRHIVHCLFGAAQRARETYLSYQQPIMVMVAAFRSTSLENRVYALKGLMCLHAHVPEQVDPYSDAQTIIQNIQKTKRARKFSDEVVHSLQAYGKSRSDITLIDECFMGYCDAMLHFTFDHGFYSLGMRLFELIGKTEFSISDRYFKGQDGKPVDMGMPFTHWLNALPRCAKAIREKSGQSKDHIANVLDLKCFLLRKQYKEARELATKALKTHTTTAFYYYVLAVASSELEEKLRWAKKGLGIQGPKVEPYVRHGLLFMSTHNASTLGFEYFDRPQKCQQEFEEAYALLKLALDDIKIFVAEAPPDNRMMPTAIRWCILLTISLKGPEISLNLHEFQPLLKRLKIAEEIESLLTGKAPRECQLLLAFRDIIKYYTSAAEEWGPVIAHFDAQAEQPITDAESPPTRSPEDELADWLNSTSMGDRDGDGNRCVHHEHVHPSRSVFGSEILMYVCAHCGKPSVALKKCTRCLTTKYCDASCQKLHWQQHKKICKPPETA